MKRYRMFTRMDMVKKAVYILIACGTACYTADAQLRFTSLQEVWDYADQHNIQLHTATVNEAVAKLSVKQAYGSLLPVVSANGAFTDNMTIQSTLVPAQLFSPTAPAGTYTEATFGRRYVYNGNIGIQLDILNTQKWFSVQTAQLNDEIATLNIAQAKAELYGQLANAYYSYILLSEAEKLARENRTTADIAYTLADNKFKEGTVSEITVNTALINKEKAVSGLDIAIQNKALQLNTLKSLLNTSDSIVLTEYFEEQGMVADNGDFAADPEVQLSGKEIQVAKNQLQSSRAAFAPTLSMLYQYNTQVAADDFLQFDNSNTTPQQFWGLRLSLPLFTGNTRRYQVVKAKMDYELKQQQYEHTKLQSAINDQNLLIAYNSSLSAYSQAQGILDLYQHNDVHAERRMNEGIISLDERLKFYSDLIGYQNEYLQSLSNYLIQQYRLRIRQRSFIP